MNVKSNVLMSVLVLTLVASVASLSDSAVFDHHESASIQAAIVGKPQIKLKGKCATFGQKAVIENGDQRNAYRVTVEIRWRKGTQSGTLQVVKHVAAGGSTYVGCTDGAGFPRKTNSFTVKGYQKLN